MATSDDPSSRRQALAQQGLLNPATEAVRNERFLNDAFFDPDDLVQVRYEMLRSVRSGELPATVAALAFGVSRATYYQSLAAFQRQGIAGLLPQKRGPRGAHKLTDEVLDFLTQHLKHQPDSDSTVLAHLLGERFQLRVHPRSIERALERRRKKNHGRRR